MMALSVLLKVTVTMALALVGVRCARRSPAAVRHVLLAAAFGLVLVLPIASALVPTITLTVPQALQPVIAPNGLDGFVTDAEPATHERTPGSPAPQDAGPSAVSLTSALAAIWVGGAVAFLLPVVIGLWRVRGLRRSALPWLDGRAVVAQLSEGTAPRGVEVLLHESAPGPMTWGFLRPVIVLPMDAPGWSREDVRRAIVHELEHVRRGDWVSRCLARMIAAGYWFHPMVWVAWRQMALEAERACDDAVLRRSEATEYADQLILLARRLSQVSSAPLLAMANRSDLAARVGAVLDGRQRRGRAGTRFVGAAVAAVIVLAASLSSIRMVAAALPSQASSAQGKLRYDTASIKPCEPEEKPTGARGTAGGTNATFSPGRFYVPCVTTEQLIYLAYASYGARDDEKLLNDDPGSASNAIKVRGGPAWVHSLRDKYRVEAVAAGATERTVLMGAMLQTLLEERFKLKLHREQEDADMMTLSIGKSGLKLKPMQEGDCERAGPPPMGTPIDPAAKPLCSSLNMMTTDGITTWTFGGSALSSLAGQITRTLGIHVINDTKIKDQFVFRFRFARGVDVFETEANIKAALEQIGLKLDKTRAQRGYLVIDAIERPTPDAPSPAPPARAQGQGTPRS